MNPQSYPTQPNPCKLQRRTESLVQGCIAVSNKPVSSEDDQNLTEISHDSMTFSVMSDNVFLHFQSSRPALPPRSWLPFQGRQNCADKNTWIQSQIQTQWQSQDGEWFAGGDPLIHLPPVCRKEQDQTCLIMFQTCPPPPWPGPAWTSPPGGWSSPTRRICLQVWLRLVKVFALKYFTSQNVSVSLSETCQCQLC